MVKPNWYTMSDTIQTRFALQMSKEQKDALQEAAKARGMSLSSYLIEAAMNARSEELEAETTPEEADPQPTFDAFIEETQKLYDSEDEPTARLARQAVTALTNLRFRLTQTFETEELDA